MTSWYVRNATITPHASPPAVPITLHPDVDELSQGRNNDRWEENMATAKGMGCWGKVVVPQFVWVKKLLDWMILVIFSNLYDSMKCPLKLKKQKTKFLEVKLSYKTQETFNNCGMRCPLKSQRCLYLGLGEHPMELWEGNCSFLEETDSGSALLSLCAQKQPGWCQQTLSTMNGCLSTRCAGMEHCAGIAKYGDRRSTARVM